jgi:hypothetical protein
MLAAFANKYSKAPVKCCGLLFVFYAMNVGML